jgi:polynucleotide 5'-kinase involved in rRNA processing
MSDGKLETSSTRLDELTTSNLVVVVGKGGVGKTTVTAVLARAAADSGRRVLVIELDGKPTLDGWLPDLSASAARRSRCRR